MSKYQIIVVIVGVVLVGWLYSLPKVVVKNKNQTAVNSKPQASSSVHNNSPDSTRTIVIPRESLLKVETFRRLFNNSSDRATKIKAADSLASVYKKNKNFDSAAIYEGIIAELSPEKGRMEEAGDYFAEAASFSADQKKVTENSEKARKYYLDILRESPEDFDVKSKLAMTYISTETPMEGIKILREVVEKDPNNQVALFNLGILSLQSNQVDKAVQRFEKLVELYPDHWKGRFYLGISYKQIGKNNKAREQFELVKKLEQDQEVVETVNGYLEELK